MFDKEEQLSTLLTRNYDTVVISDSFLYIMKSIGQRIDPWGTHVLLFLSLKKNYRHHWMALFQLSFSHRLDWIWTNLHLFLECHKNVTASQTSWSTQSETLAKFQKIPAICCCWLCDMKTQFHSGLHFQQIFPFWKPTFGGQYITNM